MKSNSKKWMFGASMLAIACGIGALTGFSGGISVSANTKNAVATYASTEQSSATISTLSVEEFGCMEDFTDWFGFGHADKDLTMSNYVTYNGTNKSIKIKNMSGGGLDFRFHLDGVVDENPYCGKTELGNFEVKMTLKGIDVGVNENVYFASRNDWDSSAAEYFKAKVSLAGTESGNYNLEATSYGGEVSYVSGDAMTGLASDGVTITVGFVNNHTYFYYGDFATNGYSVVKTTGITANANPARDGNQTFALYLTGESQTEIEILDFAYTRLDAAFDLAATDEMTQSVIAERLKVEEPDQGEEGGDTPVDPDQGEEGGNTPVDPDQGEEGGNTPVDPDQGGDEGGNEPVNPDQGGDEGGNAPVNPDRGEDEEDDKTPVKPGQGTNTGNKQPTGNQEESGGCNGSVGGLVTVGVALGACVFFKKRRK